MNKRLEKHTKSNGEIFYHVILNGKLENLFMDYKQAKELYDGLNQELTVEILEQHKTEYSKAY